MPRNGRVSPESTILVDARGEGRALRVTWHPELSDRDGLVVFSLWRDNLCVGSFRLTADDVPALLHALTTAHERSLERDPLVDTA
jgi:hypothetical protein